MEGAGRWRNVRTGRSGLARGWSVSDYAPHDPERQGFLRGTKTLATLATLPGWEQSRLEYTGGYAHIFIYIPIFRIQYNQLQT